ncbi:hypothetical protein [Mucilaginibacter sp. KACC 22063]|uniref:hypothetical protein n=1 Tax=Mucilaginibacter sp. KACC 22063 TaxID=3025666 RepID=UPI0023664E3E|nr:hypothetical protein [Mucilaginibacter sp. KACC 22063]WDF54973.1 hypothetical protein PQ461_18760 [Mucilaginibacter sp. KACC 22063]
MHPHLKKGLKQRLIITVLALMFFGAANAQTDEDAIMIPKKYFCGGVMYSNSSWKDYWEGTFKRDNQNIGTLSSNVYMAMVNYGITNNLNILASVPYVTTHASAGTLAGQKGFQDLTASLKWMPVETSLGKGVFSIYGIGTIGIPLSNYVADFQPLSIGLHAKTAAIRLMVDYQINNFFATGSGQYVQRSNITIDRESYYTTSLIYSNQVHMPNAGMFNFRTGYRSERIIAEAVLSNMTTYGGFDIRKNDMPFPSNKMNSTMAGVNFKYSFDSGIELTGGGNYTIAGRNVGQSTVFHGGIYYLFDTSSKKAAAKK